MSSLKNVSMVYEIDKKSFDEILDLGIKIKKVKDSLNEKSLVDMVLDEEYIGFRVNINLDEDDLNQILNKYFLEVGIPSYIESGND